MNDSHINNLGEEQTTFEHLQGTSALSEEIGAILEINNLMLLAGLFHDFGKETIAFEKYIRQAAKDPRSVRRGEINHSGAGGKYLFEKFSGDTAMRDLTVQLIATAIFSHHGLIDCLKSDGSDRFMQRVNPDQEIFYQEAIKNNEDLLKGYDIDKIFNQAEREVNQAFQKLVKITNLIKGKSSELHFLIGCFERLILSILIDADRTDTARFMNSSEQEEVVNIEKLWLQCQENLEHRLLKFNNSSIIGQLRKRMSEESLSFAEKETGIYCLPIPTGGGKTLCSLRFALNHAIKWKKEKIIYIAPFLSILEQNADEIRKTLKVGDFMLEHHSNVVYETENIDDIEELNIIQLLTETWQSPVIATTMVQFLNTLFGSKTQSIRRMHQLQNSIIIIDEIQSLPIKCIYMFNMMMNFLSYFCNTTVVLCSATQPLLNEVEKRILYSEPKNMVSNIEELEQSFKRVEIEDRTKQGGYDTNELAEFILSNLQENMLIILNTKSAVRKLYDALVDKNPEGILLYQLTTYMCPQHRSDTIDEIKIKLDNHRLICISTQLIEAGVDISFQCVIRSIAGLDNIMQAAGRCNRNGNDEGILGKVYIINYNGEFLGSLEDIKAAKEATEGVLFDFEGEEDKDLQSLRAMDRYYKRYFWERVKIMNYPVSKKDEPSLDENVSLYELLAENKQGQKAYGHHVKDGKMKKLPMKQAFKQAGELFSVIDSDTIGLIVPYVEAEEKINFLKNLNFYNETKKILRSLQRYTVNVFRNDKLLKSLEARGAIEFLFEGRVLILSKDFYNKEIGISDELKVQIY